MEKYCISVDWLQTFNHAAPLKEGTYINETEQFQVKKLSHETPLFRDIFEVSQKGMKLATVLQTPRTSVMHPKSTTLKLENRILYSQRYIEILYKLNKVLRLTYKGITRIDICYDCNALAGGRSVPRFLRDFMIAEPLQKGHIIRSGSSRFTAHGTRKPTGVARINSMRWGSPNNDITAYCYDKTLEMLEVKRKPWILEMWEANGLQFEVDFDTVDKMDEKQRNRKIESGDMAEHVRKSVWRFEISITAHGKDIINMRTGELFRLSPRYLEHRDNIAKLFHIYAQRAFDFRINDGVKRIRDYKPLQIFETEYIPTAKPYTVSKSADTGRTEKICFNKLNKLSEEYNGLSVQYGDALSKTMQFLSVLSGVKLEAARLRAQTRCLSEMKARRFIDDPAKIYIETLRKLEASKREINPEIIYDAIMFDNMDAAGYAEYYAQVPPPTELLADLTPDEYTW